LATILVGSFVLALLKHWWSRPELELPVCLLRNDCPIDRGKQAVATKTIAGKKFQAELVLRSSFRRRSMTPREVELVSMTLDRIWRTFEQCEGRSTDNGTKQEGGTK
jgi:hypothetical protein